MISRKDFFAELDTKNLDDINDRKWVNSQVIDEVISSKSIQQWWCVPGFSPLNTSGDQNLRPCPKCVYGLEGWRVQLEVQPFSD